MKPLILASASPRRQEICEKLGLSFTVCPAQHEPAVDPSLSVEEAILKVARAKAKEVAALHPQQPVLGADTAVIADGEVLGKPRDAADARAMLRRLAGKAHRVVTAVWLCDGLCSEGFWDSTEVRFAPMSEQEIAEYVASGEPMDKAGAYAVQGGAMRFITGLHGDFYTVMGLPSARLYAFLKERI